MSTRRLDGTLVIHLFDRTRVGTYADGDSGAVAPNEHREARRIDSSSLLQRRVA
jgi:hypothetical protein